MNSINSQSLQIEQDEDEDINTELIVTNLFEQNNRYLQAKLENKPLEIVQQMKDHDFKIEKDTCLINVLEQGSIIGEIAAFSDLKRTCTVISHDYSLVNSLDY